MGAEGPRSFSTIVAAKHAEFKHAEFISYREAITKLAEYTGEPLTHIAAALIQQGVHFYNGAFLEGAERSVVKIHGHAALPSLLNETIRTGEVPESVSLRDESNATADGDGWIRRRFIERLRAVNLPCPESLETPGLTSLLGGTRSSAEAVAARWAIALRGMASFHLWEAASVLAVIDPYDAERVAGPIEDAEIRRYKRILISAIDAGELPNNTWSGDRDEQEIPHVAIRLWCREYGYDWPIPEVRPLLATDAEMVERLRAAEAERDRLIREIAALSPVARERDNLREQVFDLTARVSELSGSLDTANARINDLSGDLAQGKSRTTMLQVVGGLVLANTDVNIFAARFDGLAKLRNDMQTVGVTIGEDALRSYLKDAADLIDKPASR